MQPLNPLTDGTRWWVPHNRWDLVPAQPDAAAGERCAVIVPYFEQPDSLRRMYAAIAVAGLDPSLHELIVVDDGSVDAPPPPPPELGIPARVFRQPDLGRRPGAARHLGASKTSAEILVFLDADTLPTPTAIAALAARVRILPDALVVGRRRHADLDGWSGETTAAWLDGSGPAPLLRSDPVWLADAYERTANLLDADERSFRYIISGVMACSRVLYEDVGGFDVDRAEYGGEDWDFAARAFNQGAVLIHEPLALVWHDEPDWADRTPDLLSKNAESLWLASRITDPATRGVGIIHGFTDIVTRVEFTAPLPAIVATVQMLLSCAPDQTVELPAGTAAPAKAYFAEDPRIRFAPVAPEHILRARVLVTVTRAFEWGPDTLDRGLRLLGPNGVGIVAMNCCGETFATLTASRAAGRARRALLYGFEPGSVMSELFGTQTIECEPHGRLHGGEEPDIATWLGRMASSHRSDDRGA